jgi:ATP-dependent exoDNAse (exonuclease V) beta subunit
MPTHLHKLTPIKFEQRIFSKKYQIAGMIDSLFLYKDKLVMVDYKTNKKFTLSSDYNKKLLRPFEEYDKCHLTEYSIQFKLI